VLLPEPAWHRVTADYVNTAHFRQSFFHEKRKRETHVADDCEGLHCTRLSRPASAFIDYICTLDGTHYFRAVKTLEISKFSGKLNVKLQFDIQLRNYFSAILFNTAFIYTNKIFVWN